MNLLETIKNQKTIDIINKNEDFYVSNKKNTAMKISENIKNPILINIINKSECFTVLNKILNTKEIEVKSSINTSFKSIFLQENKYSLNLKKVILKEFFNLFGVVSGVEITGYGISIVFSKQNKEIRISLKITEEGYVVDKFIISEPNNGEASSSKHAFYIDSYELYFDFSSYKINIKEQQRENFFTMGKTFFNNLDFKNHTMVFGTTGLGKSMLFEVVDNSKEKDLFLNIYNSIINKKYDALCDFINIDSLINDGNDSYDFILNNYNKIDFNSIYIEDLYV